MCRRKTVHYKLAIFYSWVHWYFCGRARSSCLLILLHYWTLTIVESELHK